MLAQPATSVWVIQTGYLTRTDHELNRLIREHEATAVIHTGDFGFMNADSLDRMGDKYV